MTADDPDEIDRLIARVHSELELRDVLSLIETAAAHRGVFRATIAAVERVKTEGNASQSLPGKALVTFHVGDDEAEQVETDWLSIPRARAVARIATTLIGHEAVLYKLNAPDPTGTVPQGFRRLVWCARA